MTISTSLQLKLNPNTGTYKTGDWLDITGSGFGGAPNVVLFDPVQLVAGQQITISSPKVGSYVSITGNAIAVDEFGERWLPSRDPTQEASSSENRITLAYETSPFTEFFWFHRTMAKTGLKFPWATAAGQAPAWASVNMKPWWFTTDSNDNAVDQVLPTYNGSGANCFGNSSTISANGDPANFQGYPRNNDFYVTKPTGFGFYQSGDETSFNALDAIIDIQRYDDAGFTGRTFSADPFRCKGSPELTPTVQNLAVYTVNLNGVAIPNAYVSGAAATLGQILSGVTAAINANQSTVYAIVNYANTKIQIFTINTVNVVDITASANIAVYNGYPILGASAYFRLQWMSQTNTPTGGWSNVQMLTNWMYLATGANARAAIFLGDAPTLAGCKDVRPFYPELWTNTRIVIDKMGFSGYVHHRHANGTVQNNIMGGVV